MCQLRSEPKLEDHSMTSNLSGLFRSSAAAGIAAAVALAWAPPSDARVTKIVVDRIQALGGQTAERLDAIDDDLRHARVAWRRPSEGDGCRDSGGGRAAEQSG